MRHSWPWIVFFVGVALGNVLPEMLARIRRLHQQLTFRPQLLQLYRPGPGKNKKRPNRK